LFTGRPARGLVNRFIRELGPINPAAPQFPAASNAVLRESERLWPSRTMIRVAINTTTPRNEIWMKVNSLGSAPKPRSNEREL